MDPFGFALDKDFEYVNGFDWFLKLCDSKRVECCGMLSR